MYIPSLVVSESQGWSAIVLALEIRTDLSQAMPTERETFEEGWLLAEAGQAGADWLRSMTYHPEPCSLAC